MNETRKLKREELIMNRRGLNFINETVAESLNNESIHIVEKEVDNVAPKVVGILALDQSCDISSLRVELIKYCEEYQSVVQKGKKAEDLK